jgi:hypothetical protein
MIQCDSIKELTTLIDNINIKESKEYIFNKVDAPNDFL